MHHFAQLNKSCIHHPGTRPTLPSCCAMTSFSWSRSSLKDHSQLPRMEGGTVCFEDLAFWEPELFICLDCVQYIIYGWMYYLRALYMLSLNQVPLNNWDITSSRQNSKSLASVSLAYSLLFLGRYNNLALAQSQQLVKSHLLTHPCLSNAALKILFIPLPKIMPTHRHTLDLLAWLCHMKV